MFTFTKKSLLLSSQILFYFFERKGEKMDFILELVIILFASKVAGDISVKLGQPSVLGKLLVGILLGPAVLGLVSETKSLEEFSQIGVILLMFMAGSETDAAEFKRSWKASTLVG